MKLLIVSAPLAPQPIAIKAILYLSLTQTRVVVKVCAELCTYGCLPKKNLRARILYRLDLIVFIWILILLIDGFFWNFQVMPPRILSGQPKKNREILQILTKIINIRPSIRQL